MIRFAQINVGETVGRMREVVVAHDAINVESKDFNIGYVRKLRVSCTMVAVAMGMNHKQGQLVSTFSREQV